MLQLPSKQTRRVKVARGPVSLTAPVVISDSVFVGYEDGEILRLDWPQFEPVWRIPAEGFAPNAAVGETVLLRSLREGHFRGLRITGEIAWTLAESGWAPVGDHLYSHNHGIVEADITTGAVVSHYDVPGPPFHFQAMCRGIFLLGTGMTLESDPIRAFDLGRREVIWERNLRQEILAAAQGIEDNRRAYFLSQCGSDGRIVLHCGRSLFGFAVRENRVLWQRDFDVASRPPMMHEGRVYFWAYETRQTPHNNNRLVCLDEATGETVYDLPLAKYGGDFAFMQSTPRPFVGGEYIAFGTRSGLLAVFRLSDGELVWSYKYKTEVYQPVLSGDRLLVTADDGNLLVFDGETAAPPKKARAKSPQKRIATAESTVGRASQNLLGPRGLPDPKESKVSRSEVETSDAEAFVQGVIMPLWELLQDDWEGYAPLLSKVTPGQRRLVTTFDVLNALITQSLEEYLRSEAGVALEPALEGFHAVGAEEYARVLERARSLFPEGRIPENQEDRIRALEAVPEIQRARVFADILRALSELADDAPFYRACARYIESHPGEFFID